MRGKLQRGGFGASQAGHVPIGMMFLCFPHLKQCKANVKSFKFQLYKQYFYVNMQPNCCKCGMCCCAGSKILQPTKKYCSVLPHTQGNQGNSGNF